MLNVRSVMQSVYDMVSAADKTTHIGVGLYSLPEAARIIGAPVAKIRRWAGVRDGMVPRKLDVGEETITFVELIELHFIKMFRDEGVSLQTIRKTSAKAADRFGTEYPFSVKQFDTDGRTIFATLKSESTSKVLIEDLEKGQYVFDKIVRPFFHKLEYRQTHDQGLLRFWPMIKRKHVVLDPARKFGKPIDSDSGIPTRIIANAVSAGGGQSPAVVARWLGIPVAAVKAAIAFERSLVL